MDEQRASEPVASTPAGEPTAAHEPTTLPEAPRRRAPRYGGLVGTGLALVIAFVWGGLAYRELGPKAVKYEVPSAVAGVAVRGSEAPPKWVSDFAGSFCSGDAQALADRIGPPLTGQVDQIAQALAQRDWSCSDMRYIGGGTNPKGTFYVYLMTDKQNGNTQEWWVFTTMEDKVVAIE